MDKKQLGFISALCLAAGMAQAAPAPAAPQAVLAPGASWEYTFAAPGAGWQTGGDGGVTWQVGNAPFSNCGAVGGNDCSGFDPAHDFDANTRWNPDGSWADDLWVRKEVDFSGHDLSTVQWNLGSDNGYKLFVNGTLLSQGNAEGFTWRWEYGGAIPSSLLHAGTNWIAVALDDHGGLTAFDMQITAVPVPEPETYALLLAGLGAVAFKTRRRKA